MTDLTTTVAQGLSVQLFGSSWRGITDDARRLALGEARGILAVVTPTVLDEAVQRVRAVLPEPSPTCVQPCPCDGCRMALRIELAVRGIE